jgi:hypothetical protein
MSGAPQRGAGGVPQRAQPYARLRVRKGSWRAAAALCGAPVQRLSPRRRQPRVVARKGAAPRLCLCSQPPRGNIPDARLAVQLLLHSLMPYDRAQATDRHSALWAYLPRPPLHPPLPAPQTKRRPPAGRHLAPLANSPSVAHRRAARVMPPPPRHARATLGAAASPARRAPAAASARWEGADGGGRELGGGASKGAGSDSDWPSGAAGEMSRRSVSLRRSAAKPCS